MVRQEEKEKYATVKEAQKALKEKILDIKDATAYALEMALRVGALPKGQTFSLTLDGSPVEVGRATMTRIKASITHALDELKREIDLIPARKKREGAKGHNALALPIKLGPELIAFCQKAVQAGIESKGQRGFGLANPTLPYGVSLDKSQPHVLNVAWGTPNSPFSLDVLLKKGISGRVLTGVLINLYANANKLKDSTNHTIIHPDELMKTTLGPIFERILRSDKGQPYLSKKGTQQKAFDPSSIRLQDFQNIIKFGEIEMSKDDRKAFLSDPETERLLPQLSDIQSTIKNYTSVYYKQMADPDTKARRAGKAKTKKSTATETMARRIRREAKERTA